jgi:hypothetical protein
MTERHDHLPCPLNYHILHNFKDIIMSNPKLIYSAIKLDAT